MMKQLSVKAFSAILLSTVLLFGCNPLGKMFKKSGTITYNVNPDPIEMHGDSIAVTFSGKYPPKYFHKKATMTVTPIMVSDGKVVKEFESVQLQGEAADGDGRTISSGGGSFSETVMVPYEDNMENVTVEVKVAAGYKTKTKDFQQVKVADGTVITPRLVQPDDRPILGKDKFTKIVPRSISAEIMYLINSSNVRPSELNDEDMKALKAFIEEGVEKEFTWKGVSTSAYASPDGELTLNENLANDRAKSASNAVGREMKKKKIEAAKGEGFYANAGKGEDWDGFKKLMQESDIKDKDLIIRVLSMESDPVKRETEIKNLAATYVEVAEKVLPKLRRAQVTINAEEKAKTDEEILNLAKTDASQLTVEEALYAATLVNKLDEKLSIYRNAAKAHTNDWRCPNNVGYILLLQNKVSEAEAEFKKAAAMAGKNAVVQNNLGVIARLNGDRAKAMEHYDKATSAGRDVNYNIGIVNILDGDYESANTNMGGSNTFNAALAMMLSGNNDGALSTIDASEDKTSAMGYYLKAIIGARTDNKDLLINNLRSAVSKDASLKDKAKKDAEFIKYNNSSDFDAIVN